MSNAILAIHNYGGPIHEQFDENALATIEALRIQDHRSVAFSVSRRKTAAGLPANS